MGNHIDIHQIFEQRKSIRTESLHNNSEIFDYFELLLQTFYNAIINSEPIVPKTDIYNNYKLLNYLSGIRVISISKCAMDLALEGHPVESFALSRLLYEMVSITQYLTRHPELIKAYYESEINANKFRKIALEELSSDASNKLFTILCSFAHASNNIIFMTVDQISKSRTQPVLIADQDIIANAIHGIVLYLQGQYFSLRCAFSEDAITDEEIRLADKKLFDKDVLGKLFKNFNTQVIDEMSNMIIEFDK